ncbi:helix-turn-helix transcriptional regulator [Bacteroides faecichinchillae]|nr:AraC family transcriptional regulator [Bacteroides faecichinchillae]THG57905.1 helix-turn-helix transcriptional regulator [Bacteroides faecichinchillae]
MITFLSLLYEMSLATDTRSLSSSCFANADANVLSRRIRLVDDSIKKNYMRDLTLREVAELANMSEGAFSRFFSQHTGRSFTEYLIDIRIGMVTRMLIDSNKTVAEICFEYGYNNISNFNRIFKKKKGRTPHEFREMYCKKKTIV